jgi:hypothetical protein
MTRQSRLEVLRQFRRVQNRRLIAFVSAAVVLLGLAGAYLALPSSASTVLGTDTFRRPNQARWGVASDGQSWGGDANARSVFSIASHAGHVGATNGTSYSAVLGRSASDEDVRVTGALSSFANSNFGPVARWQDGNNWYKAYLDGSNLIIQKKVAGENATLATAPFAAVSNASYSIDLRVVGTTLTARVGSLSVSATDGTFASGRTGLRVLTQSGISASIASFDSIAMATDTTSSPTTSSDSAGSTSTSTVATSTTTGVSTLGDSVAVDYTNETAVNRLAWGADETGYQSPNVLGNDVAEQMMFKQLGVTFMRMDLKVSNGQIVCAAHGCDSGVSADAYITGILNVGATPVIIVPTASPSDAATIVSHFKGLVHWFLIGNEPNTNGYSAASYTAAWNADATAMRAIDPTIKIGGPTPAWFDQTFVQTWLSGANNPDFIDFHGYPTHYTPAFLFDWSQRIGAAVAKAHAMAIATLGHDIPVEVGEWSMDDNEGLGNQGCTHSNLNTVWSADVLGEIAQNGGISLHFGTKGNMLEWSPTATKIDCDTHTTIDVSLDSPQAPYEGYAMFTGAGLFHGFGTKMAACSAPAGVDCFASDGGSHNIVLVNTTGSPVTVHVSGDVWQRAPGLRYNRPPSHLGTLPSVMLPSTSVTTVVIP